MMELRQEQANYKNADVYIADVYIAVLWCEWVFEISQKAVLNKFYNDFKIDILWNTLYIINLAFHV